MQKFVLITTVMVTGSAFAAPNVLLTNTHTNTKLESVSSSFPAGSYQLAAVCFLAAKDCANDIFFGKGDDYNADSAKQCQIEGFKITHCTPPEYLNGQCPYNNKYYARCSIDNAKACTETKYVKICPLGEKLDSNNVCPYDPTYAKCLTECDSSYLNICKGIGYINGIGSSCGGAFTKCSCSDGYTWNGAECLKNTCNPSCSNEPKPSMCRFGTKMINNGCSGTCAICVWSLGYWNGYKDISACTYSSEPTYKCPKGTWDFSYKYNNPRCCKSGKQDCQNVIPKINNVSYCSLAECEKIRDETLTSTGSESTGDYYPYNCDYNNF